MNFLSSYRPNLPKQNDIASHAVENNLLTFFPQLRLPFLYTSNNHVPYTSIWQSVEAGTECDRPNDKQALCATVVCAIQDSAHGKTKS